MSEKPTTTKPSSVVNDKDSLDRLKAAEARIAEQEAEIAKLREESDRIVNSGGLKYSPKDQPFVGSNGGYPFLVTPRLKEGDDSLAHLVPKEVVACDESEAKRWYCQKHEMKKGSGIPVDPVKVTIVVTSVGRKKADALMRQKQVSALRKKVESGQVLNDRDQELLATCEAEIYGYDA